MRRGGIQPKRVGSEWHSACPECGGTDRFRVHTLDGTLIVQCRQCRLNIPTVFKALGMLREAGPQPRALRAGFPEPSAKVIGPPRRPGPDKGVPVVAVETQYRWLDAGTGDTVIQARYDWHEDGRPAKAMRWPYRVEKARLVCPVNLAAPGPVFVCEGAKAAHAVGVLGLAAVGLTDDGAQPTAAMLAAVARRRVVLWPDFDTGGAALMERAGAAASAAGAEAVFVISPPALGLTNKGDDAADWRPAAGVDVVGTLRTVAERWVEPATAFATKPLDPFPAGVPVPLPLRILGLGPAGNLLPAGEVGILAGSGGEGKSRLTLQMAIVAAAGEDGAMLCPFTADSVPETAAGAADPFTPGAASRITVRGGPVVMVSWEDRAPWIAIRAREIAAHLDRLAGAGTRHQDVIRDPERMASVELRYSEHLFGVEPGTGAQIARPLAGWEPMWRVIERLRPRLVTVDPINLATVWEGYSATAVSLFIGGLRDGLDKGGRGIQTRAELQGGEGGAGEREQGAPTAAILLVGHTGKNGARATSPQAVDILGSTSWPQRCRATIIMTRNRDGPMLHVVKANYASTRTISLSDVGEGSGGFSLGTEGGGAADARAKEDLVFDEQVLSHVPERSNWISPTGIAQILTGGKKGSRMLGRVRQALHRLEQAGRVAPVAAGGGKWSRLKADDLARAADDSAHADEDES